MFLKKCPGKTIRKFFENFSILPGLNLFFWYYFQFYSYKVYTYIPERVEYFSPSKKLASKKQRWGLSIKWFHGRIFFVIYGWWSQRNNRYECQCVYSTHPAPPFHDRMMISLLSPVGSDRRLPVPPHHLNNQGVGGYFGYRPGQVCLRLENTAKIHTSFSNSVEFFHRRYFES